MSVDLERDETLEQAASTSEPPRISGEHDDFQSYRSMSSPAMASFGIGILSLFSLLNLALGAIPVIGILLGLAAWRSIRSRPDELTGLIFARMGVGLSVFFLLLSWTIAGVVYATELRPGFERVSYNQLQADEGAASPIPPSALELEGDKVFIKGYIHPSLGTGKGLKRFVMVRDNGDCCFGAATPKLTDMIYVQLADPLRIDYTTRLVKIHGTFHVEPATVAGQSDIPTVVYHLNAQHVD
jgi:hypothetical protein